MVINSNNDIMLSVKVYKKVSSFFNAGFIRLVAQIKISLLLKVQWKQHHLLYVKIVYKHKYDAKKNPCLKGRSVSIN